MASVVSMGGGRNLWGSHSASNKKMAAVACFSGGRNLFPLEQENLHIFFWGGDPGGCEVKVDYVILGTSRHIPGGIENWQQLTVF